MYKSYIPFKGTASTIISTGTVQQHDSKIVMHADVTGEGRSEFVKQTKFEQLTQVVWYCSGKNTLSYWDCPRYPMYQVLKKEWPVCPCNMI